MLDIDTVPEDAAALFDQAAAICKMQHVLRCVGPSVPVANLVSFDEAQDVALQRVLGSHFPAVALARTAVGIADDLTLTVDERTNVDHDHDVVVDSVVNDHTGTMKPHVEHHNDALEGTGSQVADAVCHPILGKMVAEAFKAQAQSPSG